MLSPKDAMEDVDWVHKGQSGCARSMDTMVDSLTIGQQT